MKYLWLLVLACLCISVSCHRHWRSKYEINVDLPQIQDSGKIVALTLYGSTSYFLYRGEPMGFEYEIAEQFAKSLGVKLEVKIARNQEEMVQMLLQGEGDLIAYNLSITKENKDKVLFCGDELITHQVLVQRNGLGKNNKPQSDVTQLIGKEVYSKPGRYLERLINLNKELGGGIIIHPVENDSISVEDLIAQVAKGKIDYTLCDNTLARLNKTYYTNLNVNLAISFDQRSSWAVRKSSPLLAQCANEWHEKNIKSTAYQFSAKRYFEMNKQIQLTPLLSLEKGIISHFDPLFKKYAKEINWDWRLLASLAYTESNFDTTAISWAGARGLMQLMPKTAKLVGVPEGKEENPEESIKGAIKYLGMTTETFSNITDENERIKFVLATYNAGIGHIQDAMALAEKYGKDKYRWDNNVEEYILLKSKAEYYNDSVCKFGYFRGDETYRFVKDILERTEEYKEKIKK